MSDSIDIFHSFWRRHPALLYAIGFAFGVSTALSYQWSLLLPIAVILYPLSRKAPQGLKQRLALAVGVGLIAYFYTSSTLIIPSGNERIDGKGVVTFSTLTKKQKYSREIWEYRGTIKSFVESETGAIVAKNQPCIITLNLKKGAYRPLASCDYLIEGSLSPPKGYFARLINIQSNWTPISHTLSFAEQRYKAKQFVSQVIHKSVSENRVYQFLKGIATGDFDDLELQFEFSRFGLQHIMAISGFHFAIVASFFVFFIRLFAPRKIAALILMFLMCSYFVFLGPTPSIMRAWMMILVVIGGCVSERLSNGLNSLGIAVIAILVLDPSMVQHIGFQFSTLITAGILLCYSPVEHFLQKAFAKRPLYEVIDMSFKDQHAYCVLVLMRKILALSITVNTISAPLAIYYFEKFPLQGLVYNWFFPFMVSISITLLITALLFSWIPPLSTCIHSVNTKYTSCMLDMVYNMPTNLDVYVRYEGLNAPSLITFISLIYIGAIFLRSYVENSCQERKDFVFI